MVRKKLSPKVETQVAILSRRRCCFCVFLDGHDQVVRGQIAHVNRNSADSSFENLAWLCLRHHDEYDSRASQSKGFMEPELRQYRDRLVRKYDGPAAKWKADFSMPISSPEVADSDWPTEVRTWRFPLWLVEDQVDLFAYTSGNRADGICMIERIDLPDDRVVIACMQAPGNPGSSITNSVEEIAAQVCARFEIEPGQLVWLENYPDVQPAEWDRVTFKTASLEAGFIDPRWSGMDQSDWDELGLEPVGSITRVGLTIRSNLRKLF